MADTFECIGIITSLLVRKMNPLLLNEKCSWELRAMETDRKTDTYPISKACFKTKTILNFDVLRIKLWFRSRQRHNLDRSRLQNGNQCNGNARKIKKGENVVNKQYCIAKSENPIKWRLYYFHYIVHVQCATYTLSLCLTCYKQCMCGFSITLIAIYLLNPLLCF